MITALDLRYLGVEYLAPFGEGGGRARNFDVHFTRDGGRSALCGQRLPNEVSWRIRTYSSPEYKPEGVCLACEGRVLEEIKAAWKKEQERKQLTKLTAVDTRILLKALRQRGVAIPESLVSELDLRDSSEVGLESVLEWLRQHDVQLVEKRDVEHLIPKITEAQATLQELKGVISELLQHTNAAFAGLLEAVQSLTTEGD